MFPSRPMHNIMDELSGILDNKVIQERNLMSSREEKLIKESKSLRAVLNLPDWKIGFAAWIFAGYSPLEKKERGVLIRISDETEIPCDGTDYIEAEEAQREIKQALERRVAEFKNLKKIDSKERFNQNLLIDIALENDISLAANPFLLYRTKS